ncbi:MAG: VWA domain-containing protein [Saprospiraceae bacterium]|nr:VWA domain-containing protein [Saprospiraceae bacterium]
MEERIRKWRLILGNGAEESPSSSFGLSAELAGMDRVLEALYEGDRKAGLGDAAPDINRWLGDIRRYFPSPVVRIMQKDALERLGLQQMLLEPELLESLETDAELVATLLSLNEALPDKTRETAREVVGKLVDQVEQRLRAPLRQAVQGSLNRAARSLRPRPGDIDWNRTIRANLRHYQPEYKTVIPEKLIGFGRQRRQLKHVILLVDQSGSMATSLVYAGILGSILASLRSLSTRMIVFDTRVTDLTEHLRDPVDLLFASQLGGGTDIGNALAYARRAIEVPADTILFLLSDLHEGGPEEEMFRHIAAIRGSGCQLVSLLALNDQGAPSFDRDRALRLAEYDIPAFACTPDQFPDLLAMVIGKADIRTWLGKEGIVVKN